MQYLNIYPEYTDPNDIINAPENASNWPSSFYLLSRTPHYTMSIPNGPVCHPDLSAEEYYDGLTDAEKAERTKFNFKYTKNGERQYPTKDNHYKYERNEGKKSCRFKIYRGKCIIHTLIDDYYHKDHVVVKFEF